jgi:hypothetical protein
MAVYSAYSDEAGIGDPRGSYLFAGFVASEETWSWVRRAWHDRVLNGPRKLPYLHMIDIRREAWREQHHISFNDGDERVAQAARILYSTGSMSGVGSVVERGDIHDHFHTLFKRKKNVPVGLDQPDYLCFLAYSTFTLAEVWKTYPDVTQVNFVVAQNGKITQRLAAFFQEIKLLIDPPLRGIAGELIIKKMEDEPALQAADVLCWHLQRYYAKTMERIDEGRLALMVNDTSGHLHRWEKEEVIQLSDKFRALITQKRESEGTAREATVCD